MYKESKRNVSQTCVLPKEHFTSDGNKTSSKCQDQDSEAQDQDQDQDSEPTDKDS